MSYLRRFQQIVEEIQAHPFLEVTEFKINAPTSEASFNRVEQMISTPLAIAIRNFYCETDGLALHWKIKSSITDEELEELGSRYDDYWIESVEDGYVPFAKINILSLEEAFIETNWEDIIFSGVNEQFDFAGTVYDSSDFAKMLRPFDLFSVTSCMSFLVEKGIGNPKVLLLQDHYINWESSRLTDFESYLEFLLVTRGVFQAREDMYAEYNGYLNPPLTISSSEWSELAVPKIFRSSDVSPV
jgi:hypothetical protein